MREDVFRKLNQVNFEFYQTFSTQFSETRQRLQSGVMRLLEGVEPSSNILDMGCGNGELARDLSERGHRGIYFGFDQSAAMIEIAREVVEDERSFFEIIDLTSPSWLEDPTLVTQLEKIGTFDLIFAFAVLHHIPSEQRRVQLGQEVRKLCDVDSLWMVSTWDFLQSSKWRKRICEWEEIGLQASDVEPGDYLLDWHRGGRGLRYVHHFSTPELTALANQCGFHVLEEFTSDGEGSRLGRYQVWMPS